MLVFTVFLMENRKSSLGTATKQSKANQIGFRIRRPSRLLLLRWCSGLRFLLAENGYFIVVAVFVIAAVVAAAVAVGVGVVVGSVVVVVTHNDSHISASPHR